MSDFEERQWWPHNFHCQDNQFSYFWQEFFGSKKRQMLYIINSGFDPRMTDGIAQIYKYKNNSQIDVLLLCFDVLAEHVEKANKNLQQLHRILEKQYIREEKFADPSKSVGRQVAELFVNERTLEDYTDIVVDISAMPRSTYFPLIKQLICLCKQRNLHVVVSENFQLDTKISAKELNENAEYMFSFGGEMDLTANDGLPIVWFPIFGEGKEDQLSAMHKMIESNTDLPLEICPVLPFPAKNPRRVDDIITEYHDLLFTFEIDPRNIIYADERNPFDVYRQIRESCMLYDDAFKPLGGCRKVVSALSSKLLSLGALVAAYEGGMAVAHVGCHSYAYDDKSITVNGIIGSELHEIWLVGEPYNK